MSINIEEMNFDIEYEIIEIIFKSPLSDSIDLDRRCSGISVSTSLRLNCGFLRTFLIRSLIAVAVRKLRSAFAFTMNSLPVITSVFADQNNASDIRYNIEFIVPDIVYHIGYI